METVSIITDLVLIGLLIICIIRDLRTTTKDKRNKINIYFSRSNHPSPLDPQVSLKDANEIAGKSAAKDAMEIERLEKRIETLIREKNEQFDRVRELEGKSKISNKHAKTTSKNAASGK